jgi:hypothetical protein
MQEKVFCDRRYRPERYCAFSLAGDSVVIKQVTEEEPRPLLQELTAQ